MEQMLGKPNSTKEKWYGSGMRIGRAMREMQQMFGTPKKDKTEKWYGSGLKTGKTYRVFKKLDEKSKRGWHKWLRDVESAEEEADLRDWYQRAPTKEESMLYHRISRAKKRLEKKGWRLAKKGMHLEKQFWKRAKQYW